MWPASILSVLHFSYALLGLLGSLDGIEDHHFVGMLDQKVMQAVPVVARRLHGDEDLSGTAGIFEACQDGLIAFGVVVEGLGSGEALSIPIDDPSDVFSLGDVDTAKPRISL